MKSNYEQFNNKGNNPENNQKQTDKAPAGLTKEEIMEKVREALFSLEFPLGGRYGSMLMDVLEAENVSNELKPFVLQELDQNPRYAAESLIELLAPCHGKKKLSLLDLAIETAKKKKREWEHYQKEPVVKEVAQRLYFPSSRQNQNCLTAKYIHKYDEDGSVHDITNQGEILKILYLAYSVIIEEQKQQKFTGYIKMDINSIAKQIGYTDLRHFAGSSRSLTQEQARQSIITKIEKMFVGVRGIIPKDPGRQYKVMDFHHEDTTSGIVVFLSPYINRVLELYQPTPQKNEKGKVHCNHHRLIENTALRYNAIAIEMVNIVCTGLVQAGEKNSYRVALKTVLSRSPLAQEKINSATTASHRLKILKKITKDFSYLLTNHTWIQEDYLNVRITMPQAVTMRTLEDFQICIQHDGKKKVAPIQK